MCLTKVTTRKLRIKTGFGYKVFRCCREFLHHELQKSYLNIKVGVWLKSDKGTIGVKYEEQDNSYPNGFHIFTTRKAAHDWLLSDPELVVRRVQYRGAHTKGIKINSVVVVAREIKILPTTKIR